MDREIKNLIKVWLLAITSLFYCYYVSSRFPRGIPRLMSLIPVIFFFIILPFDLTSFHLGAPTTFYLVWLGNFKLLLFAFNKGPLSPNPPLSLLHFTSIALLPIKTKHPLTTNQTSPINVAQKRLLFATKVVVFAIIIRAYEYREQLHPYFVLALNCCHVYLGVELVLALNGFAIRSVLGLELEPQFDEPYLATSLQDFWGRRWNLMVTSILRPTVYDPMRGLVGRKFDWPMWSPVPAILATFLVSGLMHEILFFYLARVSPTWEVTWFFVLHGICTTTEVVVKKVVGGRFRLHRAVSGGLTVGFVAVTGVWLFLPQMLRNGVERKAISEYGILVNFVRDNIVVLLAFIGLNF